MPGSHVALLRGINVGKAKRIAMADLRGLVEDLGYRDARTLLNSGNVVFNVPAAVKGDPAARIEKAIAAKLGFTSRVAVLTAKEVAAIVTKNPLLGVADDLSRLFVTVLRDPTDRARLVPLTKKDWSPDVIALGPPRVVYLWCVGGILESKLANTVARALGDGATTRNAATMAKLHALLAEPS